MSTRLTSTQTPSVPTEHPIHVPTIAFVPRRPRETTESKQETHDSKICVCPSPTVERKFCLENVVPAGEKNNGMLFETSACFVPGRPRKTHIGTSFPRKSICLKPWQKRFSTHVAETSHVVHPTETGQNARCRTWVVCEFRVVAIGTGSDCSRLPVKAVHLPWPLGSAKYVRVAPHSPRGSCE